MKWYYIVNFDKSVIELQLTQEQYKTLLKSWNEKDKILFEDLNKEPRAKNASSISDIMTENQYKSWLDQTNPEKYLLKGFWYARGDKNKPFRTELWKKNKLSTLAITEPHSTMSEVERVSNLKKIQEVKKKLTINR